MKRSFLTATAALAWVCSASAALAQAVYPAERPISMVVPFAAGGGTDILARLMAEKLGEQLRQSIVVQNKPGANGVIAMRTVEQAKADGYTLLFGSSSTHVLAPLMSENRSFMDEVRGKSTLVSMVADTPLVLAVSARSGARNLDQLLGMARQKSTTFGTFGAGSTSHVLGELLAARTGAKLVHVPYKGSAPAISDLRGGHIESVFLTVAAISAQVNANEIRPLAVTGPSRVPSLPDVPTFREAGVAGLEDSGWFALFAPTGTPAAVLDQLHADVAKVMALPAVQAQLVDLGLLHVPGNRDHGVKAWERSIANTRKLLQDVKVSVK